jgi:nickel/cobalt exporter
MTPIYLPLLTALVAGFAHALEADHMAAFTTFVSRRPTPAQALGFGLRWGVGHSLAILVVGGVLILLDLRFPESLARGLEFGVGAILLGLGLWLLWSLLHGRVHGHLHEHPHGRRATEWVGVAHGLAGTAPLIALLPVALIASPALATGYLLLFGVGTVVAMELYALVIGLVFHHAGERSPVLAGALHFTTALASAAIGAFWMYGAMAGGAA